MSSRANYIRIYVWELPVRIYHWLNALCILLLALTGFLIAHPIAIASGKEASFSYWFGTVRFIHFAAAYVFTAVIAFRIYWSFVGNSFARWTNFLPLRKKQLIDSATVVKVEMLQVSNAPMDFIGHNPIAYFSYAGVFLLSFFQIASGFALYTPTSAAWFPSLFGWMMPLFGSEQNLRTYHYGVMWLFGLFVLVHVYLVVYQEFVEGNGTLSSIVGGWKFIKLRVGRALSKSPLVPVEARALGTDPLPVAGTRRSK